MRLEIQDLHVAYGRTEVVFGVSLEIGDGDFTCLMGRNGVGKTTLCNALMGILPAKKGKVLIDGHDVTRANASTRARLGIGYVPQGHQVFPQLSVAENLRVVLERQRGGDASAIDEAVAVFPALRKFMHRQAGLLSGGQAQQLAIARALVSRPQLLVLDEPTEGIQPSIILEIEDAIAALHKSTGMSILLVEQYVEFALRLADSYAIMDGGLIVHSGATEGADLASFSELLAV